MKTIGMLGGMSWESTATYYELINQGVKDKLGGLHSAKLLLYSVDFAEIEALQRQGDWQAITSILANAAQQLQMAGADFLIICTNTMHKVAPDILSQINIPLLHIADATAEQLVKDDCDCVGLLGTRFTMEQDFYRKRLLDEHGIDVLVPNETDSNVIHNVIYEELCLGNFRDESRQAYLKIMDKLYQQGAQAIILGCTEIALLIRPEDTPIRLYDTTSIHSAAALDMALDNYV